MIGNEPSALVDHVHRDRLEALDRWEKLLRDIVAGKVTDTAKVMPLRLVV